MSSELSDAIALIKSARVPLYTCPTALTWALLDYFDTLKDEVRYIWPGSMSPGKFLFFWIRYYTILLVVFDVAQIHSFSKFQPSLDVCVAMDSIIRVVGAISLWSVEIIMQLRIYVLYNCSKRVAAFNLFLFLMSIGGFLWILIHNAEGRAAVIHNAKALPIPGCPVVHTGIEYGQWIPATVFEGVLFAFALMKSLRTIISRSRGGLQVNSFLFSVVVNDNLLYFFGVTALLVLNNLMVAHATHVPWFSYSPFHVAIGLMTSRMLLHLHKAIAKGRNRYETSYELQNYSSFSVPSRFLTSISAISYNYDRNSSWKE